MFPGVINVPQYFRDGFVILASWISFPIQQSFLVHVKVFQQDFLDVFSDSWGMYKFFNLCSSLFLLYCFFLVPFSFRAFSWGFLYSFSYIAQKKAHCKLSTCGFWVQKNKPIQKISTEALCYVLTHNILCFVKNIRASQNLSLTRILPEVQKIYSQGYLKLFASK